MTTNYYDVVVMGMELGPLAAGALLAKRGFRVLVVGQNAPSDHYPCFGYTFTRRPFMLTSSQSPAVRRVLSELSLNQLFQHAVHTPSPCYQVVLKDARVNIYNDPKLTESDIKRELPDTALTIREVFGNIGRINGEIDKLMANDFVVPPDSFLEKREFARAEVQNPFRSEMGRNLSNKLKDQGRFTDLLGIPVRFATQGTSPLPLLVQYRQTGGWLFDCQTVKGGRDGLRQLFADQVVGHGGDLHEHQRIAEIVVKKGRTVGIRIAGREEMTGCQVILSELSPKELSPLVPPNTWTKRFKSLVEESPDTVLGYAVNLGVDPKVIPAGLAGTAFVSFGPGLGDQLLRVEQVPQQDEQKAALHVSCVVQKGTEDTIVSGALRDAILDRVRWLIPFLDKYLHVIHSPFDGFGPMNLTDQSKGEAPSIPHPEEIPKWHFHPPPGEGVLGIENMVHRTGIKGLLLSGNQVISGLGTEGELIAAWGAARIAGKMDPRRERLVRSMRAKVEM